MSDRVRELLQELRENWRDDYWWSDHQLLATILMTILTGLVSLPFAYLQGRAKRAGLGRVDAGV